MPTFRYGNNCRTCDGRGDLSHPDDPNTLCWACGGTGITPSKITHNVSTGETSYTINLKDLPDDPN